MSTVFYKICLNKYLTFSWQIFIMKMKILKILIKEIYKKTYKETYKETYKRKD